MTNQTDLIEQRDSFKAAALREHDKMRHWMQRALTAEAPPHHVRPKREAIMSTNDDLTKAFSQHYNAFQRLAFILERKGIITKRELAEVYGELETWDLENPEESETADSGPSFRADVADGRALSTSEAVKPECCCAHHALTCEKFPVFTRDSGVQTDSKSANTGRES